MSENYTFSSAWDTQISRLEKFIKEYGVENITKTKAPKEVFNFYRHRKEDYRNNKLNHEQILDLKRIGVEFTMDGYDKEANKKYSSHNKEDIIGQKFNRLVVLEKTKKSSASGCLLFLCKCDCGNEAYLTRTELKKGIKQTCGNDCHYSKRKYLLENYIGHIFGKLTILDNVEVRKGSKIYWTAKCECGNITKVSTSNLFNPNNLINEHNCGCVNQYHNKKVVIKKAIDKQMELRKTGALDNSLINATMKIKKSNKSGYIGVSTVNARINKRGCVTKAYTLSQIAYRNSRTIIGRYENSEKGLLQGAIDRDLYIIKNNLPHSRNFSDKELLEMIDYRSNKEINNIVKILKDKLSLK